MFDTGDQESKRAKFVFFLFLGSNVGGMQKSRVVQHRQAVNEQIGQSHIEFFADGLDEADESEVMLKIRKSQGADYDLGSNATGYSTNAGDIKAAAKGSYSEKEKETNIGPVVFEKGNILAVLRCERMVWMCYRLLIYSVACLAAGALAKTTPIDLTGRKMVAPPSAAQKNTNHAGNLDLEKFKGQMSTFGGDEGSPQGEAARDEQGGVEKGRKDSLCL